jgi:hypothetical protein
MCAGTPIILPALCTAIFVASPPFLPPGDRFHLGFRLTLRSVELETTWCSMPIMLSIPPMIPIHAGVESPLADSYTDTNTFGGSNIDITCAGLLWDVSTLCAHPADTSSTTLADALGLLSRWRLSKPPGAHLDKLLEEGAHGVLVVV